MIRDAWALSLGRSAEAIVNIDVARELQQVADELRSSQAAAWLTQIEELRGTLEVNINRKVASDALLMSMAAA